MEVEQRIEIISNDLENNYGVEIGNRYKSIVYKLHNDIKYKEDKEDIEELINIQEMTLNEDHKQKQINGLQIKIKKIENKLIEQDKIIEIFKNENKELRQENKDLRNRLNKRDSLICITQVCKNIQYYIVQKITGWTKKQMKQEYVDYFDFKDEFMDRINEIENMEKEYGLYTNDENIKKIINKRNGICHPSAIELDEVKDSCNILSNEYANIIQIYDGYKRIADLF